MFKPLKKTINFFQLCFDFTLDIFFPKRCVGCNKYGNFLCFECAGKIDKLKTPTCALCGKINKNSEYCAPCKRALKTNLNGIIASASYDDITKEIIHNLKYNGVIELAELLGELVYMRIKDHLPKKGDVVTVPVPLHKKRLGVRGFNQSELICRYLANKMKLHGGEALKRIKNTRPQVDLSRENRKKNLKEAFICVDENLIKGKTVLLIDDVTTTGTTLEECAKVLKTNGAKKVFGLVVSKRI